MYLMVSISVFIVPFDGTASEGRVFDKGRELDDGVHAADEESTSIIVGGVIKEHAATDNSNVGCRIGRPYQNWSNYKRGMNHNEC